METVRLARVFDFQGRRYPDPNPRFSPEEVKDVYANEDPAIGNATIVGPETEGNTLVYPFAKGIGIKG